MSARSRLLVALGLLGAAASAMALLPGGVPTAEESLRDGERILRQRFATWRGRVERATERLRALAQEGGRAPVDLFATAEEICREESIDGAVVVDRDNRARFWAGRTFDASPRDDFGAVWRGYSEVGVLDRPAHRVLYAARPAGAEAAVAFLAFDERFPQRRDVAAEVAEEAGLASARLRFGSVPIPAGPADPLERVFVIDELAHVTLRAFDAERHGERLAERGRARRALRNLLLGTAAALAAWFGYIRTLPAGDWRRFCLSLGLIAGMRLVVPWPLWGSPEGSALTSLAIVFAAVQVASGAGEPRTHGVSLLLAWLAVATAFLLPRAYMGAIAALPGEADPVEFFNPLRVLPDLRATWLLAAVCFLTGTFFLLARATQRRVGVLALLAMAAGARGGEAYAAVGGAALACLALSRAGSRTERATSLAFLAALACFPALYLSAERAREIDIARRAREFAAPERTSEMRRRLEEAALRATDPEEGVDREIAANVATGADTSRAAFRLWAAARWETDDACAVQVWDGQRRLLSAFDFDSPPAQWLPAPPEAGASGYSERRGQGDGGAISYGVVDIPLRVIGDERIVGVARVLAPDRWDLLLANLRPSIFSEPLARIVRDGPTPVLWADLDGAGVARQTSDGVPSLFPVPPADLLTRANREGHSSGSLLWRGQTRRLLLASTGAGYFALLFGENRLEQGAFAFSRVILVDTAVCLAYVLGLFLTRRARFAFHFRHRIALAIILLSVPPVLLLALYNSRAAEERHEETIRERLGRRLDLAETLLRKERQMVDNRWCTAFAADHRSDLNIYRGDVLVATSRPGVWDTGMLARRLSATAYVELNLRGRAVWTGVESFGRSGGLRAAYRVVRGGWGDPPVTISAPALEDRRSLERLAATGNALLLAIFLLTALVTLFLALFLARGVTAPVRKLQEATARVAHGDLTPTLPENRRDEFGELIRAFNRMTRELSDAQELRVRAEKEAAWRVMARQVAHEIKNPLTPIKLTIQNLVALHDEDPEAFRREFPSGSRRILDQIDALHRIANEFSAYGRFPSRDLRPIDLRGLLEEVRELYRPSGEVELAPDPHPLLVRADRDELRRALINLLTNAGQAGARRILLRADREAKMARIEVSDDGTGIAPELMPRLFEPAFTTRSGGTGLGLALVKRIIDDHGGTIAIDSAPGKGTRVVIRLPRDETP